ncbi:MAG: hypothetical protein AB1644_05125 [Candidatus Zixiibacteriota bacterium]
MLSVTQKILRISLGGVISTALLLLWSCNTPPTGKGTDQQYAVGGSLVINLDHDSTVTAVQFLRDLAVAKNADIRLGTRTLAFNNQAYPLDSVYSRMVDSVTDYSVGTRYLRVADSTVFVDSAITTSPGTLSILTVTPANRLIQGNGQASLTWTTSSGAQGYVLAAVQKKDAYSGPAYSAYNTSMATAGTFPPDAFSLSVGDAPDTGWYYLYVYSYTGSPNKSLADLSLPAPLPTQLANNINHTELAGSFGTVVVSAHDSVHVVFQP